MTPHDVGALLIVGLVCLVLAVDIAVALLIGRIVRNQERQIPTRERTPR